MQPNLEKKGITVYPTYNNCNLDDCLGSIIFFWVWLIVEPKCFGSNMLSNPCFIRFNWRLNPRILSLTSCQAHLSLGSVGNWTQVYLVWHPVRPESFWVHQTAECKYVRPDILPGSYLISFSWRLYIYKACLFVEGDREVTRI